VLDNLEALGARCAVNYLEGMARRRARRSAGALAGVQTDGDADVGGGADAPDTS
jgi:hypothetical protein